MDAKKAESIVLQAQQAAEEVKAANGTHADWTNRVFGIGAPLYRVFATEEEREEFTKSPFQAQVDAFGDSFREGKTVAEWFTVTMPTPYIVLKNFKGETA